VYYARCRYGIYTCWARLTKASTIEDAILSNTGPMSFPSVGLSKPYCKDNSTLQARWLPSPTSEKFHWPSNFEKGPLTSFIATQRGDVCVFWVVNVWRIPLKEIPISAVMPCASWARTLARSHQGKNAGYFATSVTKSYISCGVYQIRTDL